MDDQIREDLKKIAETVPGMSPWILGEDGRTPVQTDFVGYMEWAEKVGGLSVQVRFDVIDGTTVSTVFLDQFAMAGNPSRTPKLFETLVAGADGANVEDRYATWDEAELGHEEILHRLRPNPARPRGMAP